MPNYTKLFNTIVTSTIWQEPDRTRIVWITMLALSDKNGEIHASIPGLARVAGVPTDDCEKALNAFLSPDPYSRTPEHEGRRIAKIDGGWELLNFQKYRLLASTADTLAKNATRQKRFRERNGQVTDSNATVTPSNGSVTHDTVKAEADTKAKSDTDSKADAEEKKDPPLPASTKPKGITEGKNSERVPTTEQSKRFAAIFRRRESTAWSEDEISEYKKLGTVSEEDLSAVENFYKNARGCPDVYLRMTMLTFLRHFRGEVDKAKTWNATREKMQTPALPGHNSTQFKLPGHR